MEQRPTDSLEGATVLVADDEPHLLHLVRFRLEREGATVLTAADGDAALATARERLPDLCMLDVSMPRRSGLDVLRELRADARCRGIKVIMLTASTAARDAEAGRSLGADDYIRKPFTPRELRARVRSQLGR
jgi:DNA-binding response OmpR family regulator